MKTYQTYRNLPALAGLCSMKDAAKPGLSIEDCVARLKRYHYSFKRLHQSAPPAIFEAFCESRLAGWMPNAPLGSAWGPVFGTLGTHTDFDTIIARAMPR